MEKFIEKFSEFKVISGDTMCTALCSLTGLTRMRAAVY